MLFLPILPTILQFLKFVIDDIEPFLHLFQAERPLVLFLHQKLKTLMLNMTFYLPRGIGERVVNEKILKKYLPFRKNVGFCLIKLVEKFREQSSLKYRLTLCLSSISPIHIKDAISMSLYSRFKKLLQCLDELGEFRWISSKTEIEYRKFISEANIREEMSEFEMSERLDKFYASLLDNTKMNLWKVVKLRLIL